MELLRHNFEVSGVETYLWLPPLVMFLVSALTSTGGVSGAFVLLPFQMSALGYTSPGVSATNFVYNIIAIPLGVLRYIRTRQLSWPLVALILPGILPGVFVGYLIRVTWLPDPAHFRPLVGLVLLALTARMLWTAFRSPGTPTPAPARTTPTPIVLGGKFGWTLTHIEVDGSVHEVRTRPFMALCFFVGIIGGAYGIGGGSVLAPVCIAIFGLPPAAVVGAILTTTWVTSVVAAFFYALDPVGAGASASPDWLLGALFGLGGMAGVYVGSRLQRLFPPRIVKVILSLALVVIGGRYVIGALLTLLR